MSHSQEFKTTMQWLEIAQGQDKRIAQLERELAEERLLREDFRIGQQTANAERTTTAEFAAYLNNENAKLKAELDMARRREVKNENGVVQAEAKLAAAQATIARLEEINAALVRSQERLLRSNAVLQETK